MGNTATDATAMVESTPGNAERVQQAGKGVAAKCDKKEGDGYGSVIHTLWKYMNGENRPLTTEARAVVSQMDERDERPSVEEADSAAVAVDEAIKRESEEDGEGTGEEYEDAEEEREDEEEEDEGESGEEPSTPLRIVSRFAEKTADEIEVLLLESLDHLYDNAIDSLTKMGYPKVEVKRVVLNYGSCWGDKDALSNIICNASEYLNVDDEGERESGENGEEAANLQGEDIDGSLYRESLEELKRDGLTRMVKKMQEVKPTWGRGDALWELLLNDLDITRALEKAASVVLEPAAGGSLPTRPTQSPVPETPRLVPHGPASNAAQAAGTKAAPARAINGQAPGHPASSKASTVAGVESASTPTDITSPFLRTGNGHAATTTANPGAPPGASRTSHAKGKARKGKQPATSAAVTAAALPSNAAPSSAHQHIEAHAASHRHAHVAKQRLHQTHKDSVRVLSSSKTKLASSAGTRRAEACSAVASTSVTASATIDLTTKAAAGADSGGTTTPSHRASAAAAANKDGTVSRPAAAAAAAAGAVPPNSSSNLSSQPVPASSALPAAPAGNAVVSREGPAPPFEGLQVALSRGTELGMHEGSRGGMLGDALPYPQLTGRDYVDMASCLPPYMQISSSALKKWIDNIEARIGHLRRESHPPVSRGASGTCERAGNLDAPGGEQMAAAILDELAGEPGGGQEPSPDPLSESCSLRQPTGSSSVDAQALVGEVQELLDRVRHHAGKLPPSTIEELSTSVDGLIGGSTPWMSALEQVLTKDCKETESISGLLQQLKDALHRVSAMEGTMLATSGAGTLLLPEEDDTSRPQTSACETALPVTPIAGKVVTPTASSAGISGRAAGLQDLLASTPEDDCGGAQGPSFADMPADVSGDLSKMLDGIRSLFNSEPGGEGPDVDSMRDSAGTGVVVEEAGSGRSSVTHVVDNILQKLEVLGESNRELLRHCLMLENMVSTMEQYSADRRTGRAVDLEKRVKELEDEAKASISWTHDRVSQAARRLAKDAHELKSLRAEREEVVKTKKDLQLLQETTAKKVADLEAQLRKVGNETSELQKKFKQLQTELGNAKAEMQAAKLDAAESQKEKEEMVKREKKLQKKLTTLENQKKKAEDNLNDERRRAIQVEKDLGQAREQKQQAEVRWRQEEKAREEAVAKYDGEKRAREQAEAASKRREESLRRKAETDAGRHREQVQQLEREVAQLRLVADGASLATSRWGSHGGGNTEHTAIIQALQSNNNSLQRDLQELQDKLQEATRREVRRDRECVMCMSEEISVLFLPCAHEVVCSACNDRHLNQGMRDCPSCRTVIKQRIRVYGVS